MLQSPDAILVLLEEASDTKRTCQVQIRSIPGSPRPRAYQVGWVKDQRIVLLTPPLGERDIHKGREKSRILQSNTMNKIVGGMGYNNNIVGGMGYTRIILQCNTINKRQGYNSKRI